LAGLSKAVAGEFDICEEIIHIFSAFLQSPEGFDREGNRGVVSVVIW